MGSDIAEAQIDELPDAEIDALLEIYEVLRLTPDNGRKLVPTTSPSENARRSEIPDDSHLDLRKVLRNLARLVSAGPANL